MFVCFTNILEACNTPPRKPCRGHCDSLSNPTRQKKLLLEQKFFKKLLLEPTKFYQNPLPPSASLTQWVVSRNWVSTARPTQPALLVGAPWTSHILTKLSLNNLDNMLSKNQTKKSELYKTQPTLLVGAPCTSQIPTEVSLLRGFFCNETLVQAKD